MFKYCYVNIQPLNNTSEYCITSLVSLHPLVQFCSIRIIVSIDTNFTNATSPSLNNATYKQESETYRRCCGQANFHHNGPVRVCNSTTTVMDVIHRPVTCFEDWILSPSSGGTYSFVPNNASTCLGHQPQHQYGF
jgi:hypothetical protein